MKYLFFFSCLLIFNSTFAGNSVSCDFEEVYEDFVHTRPLMYDAETTLNHYVIEKEGGLSVRLIKIK